ncbi:MAG: helix-turn-helix transcriptional regulator [Chitinophagaceae bacterium]
MKNNLKEYREKKAYTQEQLAVLAEVSRQSIISIEKGYYTPTTILALKLAEVLKAKVDELFVLEKNDWTQ